MRACEIPGCTSRAPVYKRRDTGKLICGYCRHKQYYHDTSKHERCGECKRKRFVVVRRIDGPRCITCYGRERKASRLIRFVISSRLTVIGTRLILVSATA